jgi:hypothetical protein
MLIMKGELQQEVIQLDPAIQAEVLESTIKQLWIAKGSFCEE